MGLLWSFAYVGLGWASASWLERQHFTDIERREYELSHIRITPMDLKQSQEGVGALMMGSTVVAHDLFRRLMIGIGRIFGGNIHHYERLVERGRREAILRLKEEASAAGAHEVQNIRLQTTNIKSGGVVRSVEVLAYGTAIAE